jgi:hypothetical protein
MINPSFPEGQFPNTLINLPFQASRESLARPVSNELCGTTIYLQEHALRAIDYLRGQGPLLR